MLINSSYVISSDEVNAQIDSLNSILKKYDKGGMLIGEAPCTKDLIACTDHDFTVVSLISIIAIFVIILLVQKSFSVLHRHRAALRGTYPDFHHSVGRNR